MSILVTGGTGFVGVHVMYQLAMHGESVISLSTRGDLDDVAKEFLGQAYEKITCVKGDVLDLEGIRRELRHFGVKTVVHGAAITAIGELEREIPYQAVMVNVGGTATMLEASRLEGVKRFIYLSSATIYGSSDPRVPLAEDDQVNPSGIYAVTKYAGEQVTSRYMDLFEVEGAIARISTPYGPLERPTGRRELMSPVFGWCRAAKAGEEVILSEDLQRDFTYAVDTAKGIQLLCNARSLPHRVYNISSGRNARFQEVLEALTRLCPSFSFRCEKKGELSEFFRSSLRGPLDITRARGDVGYEPQYDVETGLRDYLGWLKKFPV